VTTTSDTNDQSHATAASPTGAETATTTGMIAALVGAIPIIGPALLAGCLSCAGIGAAAGLGATGALPPAWWLAGLTVTGMVVAGLEHRNARRCQRRTRIRATIGTLVLVAAVAWFATRYGLLPAIDWLNGPDTTPTDGPILP
jgi:hypothetical protein